mmetsp:Transcript_18909/g.38670  ORF Transcript_18909/g.38670 Transcript_18909/m.38670 type:complete len:216 (+) Transcript_18909:657-1304(+)
MTVVVIVVDSWGHDVIGVVRIDGFWLLLLLQLLSWGAALLEGCHLRVDAVVVGKRIFFDHVNGPPHLTSETLGQIIIMLDPETLTLIKTDPNIPIDHHLHTPRNLIQQQRIVIPRIDKRFLQLEIRTKPLFATTPHDPRPIDRTSGSGTRRRIHQRHGPSIGGKPQSQLTRIHPTAKNVIHRHFDVGHIGIGAGRFVPRPVDIVTHQMEPIDRLG